MGGRSILSNWIVCQNMVLVWLAIDDFFYFFYRNGEEYIIITSIMDQDDHYTFLDCFMKATTIYRTE